MMSNTLEQSLVAQVMNIPFQNWKGDSNGRGDQWYATKTSFGGISLLNNFGNNGKIDLNFYNHRGNSISFYENVGDPLQSLYYRFRSLDEKRILIECNQDLENFNIWVQSN